MPKPPNLLRKVQHDGKWKMLPVVRNKNAGGEQRFDLSRVLLAGSPIVVTAGTFYLEYREDGKRVRRSVGDHPTAVKAALATQASVLVLRSKGVAVDDAPEIRARTRPSGKTIRTVVDAFVKSPPLEYRHKSYLKYRNALETFEAWSTKRYVMEIDRGDIKAFLSSVVHKDKLAVSTAVDKGVAVAKILRDQGAPILMRKGDWPRVTKRQREIYKPEILKKLFAAADPDQYDLFQTFLLTGFREREVSYLSWPDFEPDADRISVTKKPGFDPKNYEERSVPLFAELKDLLIARCRRHGGKGFLLFPSASQPKRGNPGGQADGHLLRRLKTLAFGAGLNCGRCQGKRQGKRVSCAKAPVCKVFTLHKFRHTYATTLLRDGVDLVSLQTLLGHKDLDSTREYLRALEPDDLLTKIQGTSLATRFV